MNLIKKIFNNKWNTWEGRCQACAYGSFLFSQSECLKKEKMLKTYCHHFQPSQGDWESRCHGCSYFEATYNNDGIYVSGASCYKDNFVMSTFCPDFHKRETMMIGEIRCCHCENFYIIDDSEQGDDGTTMGCYREKNFNKTWCRSFYPRSSYFPRNSYFGKYEVDKIQKYIEERQFG